jgi:repressor LexA
MSRFATRYALSYGPAMGNVADLIRQIQLATGWTQSELAEKLDTTQANVSRWVGGSEPKRDNYDKIVAQCRQLGLYVPVVTASPPASIVVSGFVGTRGEVFQGGVPRIEAPMVPSPTVKTVALIVQGDAMAPEIRANWIIYYEDSQSAPSPDIIGMPCVVALKCGKILVRTPYPGRNGLWNLAAANGVVSLDQDILWAELITFIKPQR